MHAIEIVILLLVFVLLLALVGNKLKIVLPLLLTCAGLGVGLIPGLPVVALEPSVVLLVFLPPILYGAAWYTHWFSFKQILEPVLVLALGLVLVTSIGVAYVSVWFIPGFTLSTGFLLGAIISPPDAVAATAVLKKLPVPKKVMAVLEGESLINDASALVAFQLSIVAISLGQFDVQTSISRFLLLSAGGVGIGLAVGCGSYYLHKIGHFETALETVLTFLTAYASFIIAEKLHVSGVLATVTAGLIMGQKQSKLHTPEMRIQAVAVWDFVQVLLHSLIFILIGLQLPVIIRHLPQQSLPTLAGYSFLITNAIVAIRFLYIFGIDAISNFIRRKLQKQPIFSSKKHTAILAFTGMRGVVSLAAAFSIPVTLVDGKDFPNRDLILFISFGTIFFTLVVQGFLLPYLVKWLKLDAEKSARASLSQVRSQMAKAVAIHLRRVIATQKIQTSTAEKIMDWYTHQIQLHAKAADTVEEKQLVATLLTEVMQAKRNYLHSLRMANKIEPELYHQLEHEIDLEAYATQRKWT